MEEEPVFDGLTDEELGELEAWYGPGQGLHDSLVVRAVAEIRRLRQDLATERNEKMEWRDSCRSWYDMSTALRRERDDAQAAAKFWANR